MKNKEIIQLYEGIYELREQDFGVKVGFIFAKNLITLEPYYKAIKASQRKLWEKYGSPNEEGHLVVSKDKISDLEKENDELMEIETIVNITKISIEQLEECKINLDQMLKIYYMIEENRRD